MYCRKCGALILGDAKFCTKCGIRLQEEKRKASLDKKRKQIICLFIMALLVSVGVVLFCLKAFMCQEFIIKIGEKHLANEEYNEALDCYEKLKIADSQSEEVYLYGADVYLAQNEWEKAIEIIDEGIEALGSKNLQKRREYICESLQVEEAVITGDENSSYECKYDIHGNIVEIVVFGDSNFVSI